MISPAYLHHFISHVSTVNQRVTKKSFEFPIHIDEMARVFLQSSSKLACAIAKVKQKLLQLFRSSCACMLEGFDSGSVFPA